MPTSLCSLSDLRFVLRHLYEPRALQTSPLVEVLGAGGEAEPLLSVRLTLTSAIEALKPGVDAPPQSPARRAYEILYYRYVQQCTQREVANQLGLSMRHLKREQRKALERLAQYLGEQLGLRIDLRGRTARKRTGQARSQETSLPKSDVPWTHELPRGGATELGPVFSAVTGLVQPIAGRYGVHLRSTKVNGLPALAVDAVVLRQMLLSLLCVGIRQAADGELRISAKARRWQVEIRIESLGSSKEFTPEDTANLGVAHQLARSCGAGLSLPAVDAPFVAKLVLPAAQRVPVLVIDDHVDAVQLLQRYATDTPYRVFGAQNAEQAFDVAAETSPQIIVLDVMLPEVDGWEVLGRLKQHPLTGHIPVVACTIVAQEELALSLGVSAFLRKPVSRRDFLATLDRLLPLVES